WKAPKPNAVDASFGVSTSAISTAPSGRSLVLSTFQSVVRAKPCAGPGNPPPRPPNQGQMIGTPPRIALPGANRLFELVNNTGRRPPGVQCATCAPCVYRSPSAFAV